MNGSEWPDMTKLYAVSVKAEESLKGSVHHRDMVDLGSASAGESNTTIDGLSSYNTYSYLENSTAAPSVTSDCEEDVDDDELLSWVASGMLPVNTSTTLALNQAYQEILEQLIGRIEGIVAQIRERKKLVQKTIDQNCAVDTKVRTSQKVPVLSYVCPYFRDSAGLCPGLNREAKRMREGQYFDMLIQPKPKWSKKELSVLHDEIAEMTLQTLVAPLENKRDLMKERSLSDDIKVIEAKKLDEAIFEVHKEIRKLMSLKVPELVEKSCHVSIDWNELAVKHMDGSRSANDCRLAWTNQVLPQFLNKKSSKVWTKDELLKLKTIAERHELRNWVKVAEELNTGRTAFECFEEYQVELNENLVKRGWTKEEEDRLKEVVDQIRIGNYIPWQQVTFFVEGKTRDQCQRHYKQCLDEQCRKGRWTEEEDLLLIKAVEMYGEKDWSKISDFVLTRTDIQCRERWCLTLNSNFKAGPWTKREDATLLLGASMFGVGNWIKIAQLLPGRSAPQCKTRYRSLRDANTKKDTNVKTITVSLHEDETPAEKTKLIRERKRQQFFDARKNRVKNFYKQEYGHLPEPSKPTAEVGKFLQSLPNSLCSLINDKLSMIQKIYGGSSEKTASRKNGKCSNGPQRSTVKIVERISTGKMKNNR